MIRTKINELLNLSDFGVRIAENNNYVTLKVIFRA